MPPPSFVGTPIVSPYNTILGLKERLETESLDILFDNEALGKFCARQLGRENVSLTDMNRLIAL